MRNPKLVDNNAITARMKALQSLAVKRCSYF
jgi:hypothetical protein